MSDINTLRETLLNQLIEYADHAVRVLTTLRPGLPPHLQHGACTAIERVQAARRSFGHLHRALQKPEVMPDLTAAAEQLLTEWDATYGGAGSVGPPGTPGQPVSPASIDFHTRLNARENGVN